MQQVKLTKIKSMKNQKVYQQLCLNVSDLTPEQIEQLQKKLLKTIVKVKK